MLYIGLVLVCLIALMIIMRVDLPMWLYFLVLFALVIQALYYHELYHTNKNRVEHFLEPLSKLDGDSIKRLVAVPLEMKAKIIPGFNALMKSGEGGDDKMATLSKSSYPDDEVRLDYKRMSFMMDKVKDHFPTVYKIMIS
jgi:hypothetical protein